jgi:hypothetical protein
LEVPSPPLQRQTFFPCRRDATGEELVHAGGRGIPLLLNVKPREGLTASDLEGREGANGGSARREAASGNQVGLKVLGV